MGMSIYLLFRYNFNSPQHSTPDLRFYNCNYLSASEVRSKCCSLNLTVSRSLKIERLEILDKFFVSCCDVETRSRYLVAWISTARFAS